MNKLLQTIRDHHVLLEVVDGKLKAFAGEASIPPELIAAIQEHKQELITFLLTNSQQNGNLRSLAHIPKASHQPVWPLSSSQQRLWVSSQLSEGNTAYNMPGAFILKGPLDTAAFHHAFGALIERHEILRTVFRQQPDGQAAQYILPATGINFNINSIDLRGENSIMERARELAWQEMNKPFDLSTGPLISAALYRTGAEEWLFSFVIHHIICDGWSMGLLIKELLLFYKDFGNTITNTLPPLRIHYKDYAVWQQARLQEHGAHKTWWMQQLAGRLPLLQLPADQARPAVKTYQGGIISTTILPSLTGQFKSLCQEEGATLFMGLLATLNILLYRYSGQQDIIIGSPVAGRSHPELEEQIGCYLNNLAFRTRFTTTQSFRKLLSQVKTHTLEAYEHQEYPFDELVESLQVQRDLSRNPLFDVMLLMQNFEGSNDFREQHAGTLSIQAYRELEMVVSKYDLTFYFTEQEEGLHLKLEYSSDLFTHTRMEQLIHCLQLLLISITSQPDASIDTLVMATVADRQRPLLKAPDQTGQLPCTEHQKRLWFIDQFEQGFLYPAGPVYHNLPLLTMLPETIGTNVLVTALEQLLSAYPILRTTIQATPGGPGQLVQEEVSVAFNEHRQQEGEETISFHDQCLALIDIPFDIEKGPLIRFDLIHQKGLQRWLLITAHHLVADRATLRILFRQLMALCNTHQPPQPSTVEGLSFQDFARWQQSFSDDDYEASLRYWTQKLQGAPVLYLDTDRPREHIHIYKAATCRRLPATGIALALTQLAAQWKVSPFMILLAAFKVVMYRYSGNDTIVIGTLYANRDKEVWNDSPGPFANLLSLVTTISGESSFYDYLQQVITDYEQAVRAAAIPFERVVEVVNPGKDMSRTAIFDVLIQYETNTGQDKEIELNLGTGKYDLNLLVKAGDDFDCFLTYNSHYFMAARMEKLLQYYHYIIEQVIAVPDIRIEQLELLSPSEKQELLSATIEDKPVLYPTGETMLSLLEAQCERTPGNIALVFDNKIFTYRHLYELANQLGHYLRQEYQVQPNDLVGIRLERSEWMVIAIFGILKAGGAYVPMDPAWPQERIDHMIEDGGCKVVIDAALLQQFSLTQEQWPATDPLPVNSPGDLLYVIYTSGTTGRPKGSLIDHHNVVRLFFTDQPLYDFKESDTWTMFHSYCFDFSVWEMYGALLFGGKLVVVPTAATKDPDVYLRLLRTQGVTILNQTPSAFYNLMKQELEQPDAGLQLRMVIFGGEALTPAVLGPFHQKYPHTRLINMYGITETTVHVTYKPITAEEIASNSMNIGTPIPTLWTYVLDPHQHLLPPGITGELYVGGEGVCRGYLNREALTRQRFITNPFKENDRLYRTGDKVKRLANGELEYAGRIDDQVKIRGYRIELGEIANALRGYENVEEAIVLAKADQKGELGLVAYIVSAAALNIAAIRIYLANHLPAYMIPAWFVQLDKLPLTGNGKLNRQLLPDPIAMSMDTGVAYLPPRDETEARLVDIWAAILGRTRISIKDNFFELGGHSLKATKLASLIHRDFAVKPALRDLFTNTVLEEQAQWIKQARTEIHGAIEQVPQQAAYPLSAAQRRLWILSQFADSNTAYNMPVAYLLEGHLDINAFRQAFDRLVHRHESLRTLFRENKQGDLQQWIQEAASSGFTIGQEDYRGNSHRREIIKARVLADFDKPFQLETGPLLRACLYQVEDQQWVFSYVMHHIISDGWSMDIVIKELLTLYNAFVLGAPDPLSPLRIQYKDYAAWQQQQLQGANLQQHKDYWLQQFAGELPVLELPADRARPPVKTYNGAAVSTSIDEFITAGIRQLSQEQGSTLFMGLVAAVNVLLHRYTGQEDIIIGTPVAGRSHIDLENQIGFYTNTLALRFRLSAAHTYQEVLREVQQVILGAYEHQAYPLDELVEALHLQRDRSRHPLFETEVVLQHAQSASEKGQSLQGLQVTPYADSEYNTSRFDLVFDFRESGDTLAATLTFNSDIYSAATAQRMLGHLQQLMKAIVLQPEKPLAYFKLLTAPEENLLLQQFNDTTVEYPANTTLVSLFETAVRKFPQQIALQFGDTSFTYAALHQQTSQLASYLRGTMQLEAGELVGIMLDRSATMIVAILGVLQAGAAYVPIDPAYPKTRKQYITGDTAIKTLITQTDYIFDLDYFQGTVLAMDVQAAAIQAAVSLPPATVGPAALAYVIYTSGSTGQPKGVMISHGKITNTIFAQWESFGMNEGDRHLQYASLSFDASVSEIFVALASGGTLFVIDEESRKDPALLVKYIRDHQINLATIPPALLKLIDVVELRGLSKLITAGEPAIAAKAIAFSATGQYFNAYGPTESSICATIFHQTGAESFPNEQVPIGKPIANTRIYIIDQYQQLSPIGVEGEICIGGAGLSQGYWNNAALTAEKFIPNPFIEGDTIYRTGDIGRWLADGNIEFIGRKDDQVKIRGNRVELGEIEHALQSHPSITDTAVVTRKIAGGEKEIIAYVVSSEPLQAAALADFLGARLPVYMLPVHYVQLNALPLNTSGKIDRKQLPDPEGLEMASGVEYIAPRNRTEAVLTEIWSEILAIAKEKISMKDDFFALGGHSLKATRLVSQLHKAVGVKIDLKEVFAITVLEEQALFIEQAGKTVFTAIQPALRQAAYPLSSSQRRLWILSQLETGSIAYHLSGVWSFEGTLNEEALTYALDTLIGRHEILRTLFKEDAAGEVQQYIIEPLQLGFQVRIQDCRQDEQWETVVRTQVQQENDTPFNLRIGPLLRATLYRVSDDRWVFSFVMHHIISDGWSMEIMISELLQLYSAYVEGQLNILPELRIQYKDYAVWQQEQLQGGLLQTHRSWWLQQLGGELPVIDLPTDHKRPAVKTYRGQAITGAIDPAIITALRSLGQEQHATLFMTLLAAIKVLLYKYTGQEDLLLGSPVAGRLHADLDRQIGFYLNILPLRTRFSHTDNFNTLLGKVKESTLGAYDHQAYPFDQLVDDLQLPHNRSRHPVFDVLVDFHDRNTASALSPSPALEVNAFEAADRPLSKFDLSFLFTASEEGVACLLEYNTDLFEEATIQRLRQHFHCLLASIVANPGSSLNELTYLPETEKQAVQKEFNAWDHQNNYKGYQSVLQLFSQQVLTNREAPAVIFENSTLTYANLHQESNQLAVHLQTAYGVGKGHRVAIMLERSEQLLIAIWAVLKAGAAYVPIEADYPAARKQYILQDSSPTLLITQSDFIFDLNYYTGQLFAINVESYTGHAPLLTDAAVSEDDTAYMIYTSGSTGQPKGCSISHGNLSNYIQWANNYYFAREDADTGPYDRPGFGLYTSLSFDLTVTSIFCTLTLGGQLHVYPQQAPLADIFRHSFSAASGINSIKLTPSHINYIKALQLSAPAIRCAIVGGEELTQEQVTALKRMAPGIRVFNEYGPTETTVGCMIKEVAEDAAVLIGRPIAHTAIYILDENRNWSGIGIAGEICVSGKGVGRGYWNNQGLTEARFVADPLRPGEKMYCTGDLGRWLPNGELVFLGRKDEQVKLRGYRIELGEIESRLLLYPGIDATAVMVRTAADGEKELVAYIVASTAPDPAQLREHLGRSLPAYMIPSRFVPLEALPLTNNGKIDKKRLPAPEGVSAGLENIYTAPRTATEMQLANIWQQLLGLERVGAKDDFFALGGHSLKATRLLNQVQQYFNVQLELAVLFEYAVLDAQAAQIDAAQQYTRSRIMPAEPRLSYELSSGQRRLWILSRFAGGDTAYHLSGAYVFSGVLNESALSDALYGMLERHEILRTVFRQDEQGMVKQYILPVDLAGDLMTYYDWRKKESEASLSTSIQQSLTLPFDLSAGPLLRVALYRIREDQWVLSYVMHHIISDGWSMEILIAELLHLYNSKASGQFHGLPELRIQYKDYAAWQQEQLSGELLDAHKSYWLTRLAGELPVHELPVDFPRPAIKSYRGAAVTSQLPEALTNRLQAYCRQQGATLFMGLLAAVNGLLYKYSGQQDIIIGSPVAGRTQAALDEQIGLYMNTLPLRTRFNATAGFAAILAAVKDTVLGAYDHQLYPFDELVDALQLQRDLSRHPLFDVMMVMQHKDSIHERWQQGLQGLQVTAYEQSTHVISKFDLLFAMVEKEAGIEVQLEYNTDIFEAATAERLLHHLETLLEAMVRLPEVSLQSLSCVDAAEQQILLELGQGERHAYQSEATLAGLFREQVARRPAHTALVFEDRDFSYTDLDEQSNQLAHWLQERYSLGRADLAAVQLDRSEWLVLSLLAILKTGAAYVPIDPRYPAERIAYIQADTHCKVIINEQLLSEFKQQQAGYSKEALPQVATADDLAYVIYTSGSTGQPKGCMLEHRGVVNRLEWMWDHYGFTTEDIILQKTTFTFDVSVWELFLPLCFGAKMVLCTAEDTGSPERIAGLIHQQRITCLHFVPSILQLFVNYLSNDTNAHSGLDSMRLVITSGEALPASLADQWYGLSSVPLHNLYGPTEASVDVSYYPTAKGDKRIPIGKPIWNTQLYILQEDGALCGRGIAGELCIGGVGVARGYLNKEELTAAKFTGISFNEADRIYRTGDQARWLSDGNIEYLGRRDEQVKLRGYRIELGEIESCLLLYPAIDAAAVMVRTAADGEKELVAYIVTNSAPDILQLREYLGRSLPVYMIPSRYVTLEALPMTTSGKIDRKRLATAEGISINRDNLFVAPSTITEIQLAAIWQELLGKEMISAREDFFAAGGHSLKATRLLNYIQKQFSVQLTLADLFITPVLAAQAALIEGTQKKAWTLIVPVAEQAAYTLSAGQRRLWILSQFAGGDTAYHLSGAYVFNGQLDTAAFEKALNGIIGRHEILRTLFREDELGEVLQVILPAGDAKASIFVHDLRQASDKKYALSTLARQELQQRFDLGAGPLLRAGIYRLEDDQWVFHYVMHHIISDGWSMEIMLKELLGWYHAQLNNQPILLQPLRIQYKDYAAWQQEQLSGELLDAHKSYWLTRLAGELPVPELPVDFPRPAIKSYRGAAVTSQLPEALTNRLQAYCRQQGATLFMGLLAAVNGLLYKYSGQQDIIIGSPVAGRTQAALDEQIGLYMNTLPLRTRFNATAGFAALLTAVKDSVLGAYDHQLYPFDQLVDALQLQRDLSRHPLFDVMIVMQQGHGYLPAPVHEFKEWSIAPYQDIEQVSSKFDLLFGFNQSETGIEVQLEYNTDIFEAATAERLVHHLETLLEAMVRLPEASLQSLSCVDAAEQQILLELGQGERHAYQSEATLAGLFREQVALRPDHTALVFEDRDFSFTALDEQSNQLAHWLQERYSIGRADLAAVQLDRSEWLVISLLAILKTGAAYVPIDPRYPAERIAYIQEDTHCKVIINEQLLKAFQQEQASCSKEALTQVATADDLAYVIYTSGSTGQPKGCMLEHRGVINRLEWMWDHYGFTTEDIILQKTTFTFDVSVWELFLPLCFGAKMVLCTAEDTGSPERIAGLIKDQHITCLHFVPSILQLFVNYLSNDTNAHSSFNSMRLVITSGEALPASLADQWYTLTSIPLHNLYGPTEASVDVSYYPTARGDRRIPIGKPIWNTQLYILQEDGGLCGRGIAGELCIGGVGVARGYLNKEELTAAKFTNITFNEVDRIYRTGDQARWLSDGNIEYLGRRDEQVKLRGYRIELGEIESQLQQYPGIRATAVALKAGADGEKMLAAYLVSDTEWDAVALRNWLSQRLPVYMIPAYFLRLEQLPLSANGKISKQQLPQPDFHNHRPAGIYTAPRNETEEKLVQIWSEVLGIPAEKIGIHDDFFILGGHSLKATRLILRLYKTFGVRVSIEDVFTNPTIEVVSDIIRAEQWLGTPANGSRKENRNTIEV